MEPVTPINLEDLRVFHLFVFIPFCRFRGNNHFGGEHLPTTYFFKFLSLTENPPPQEIPIPSMGEYGYFLHVHIDIITLV